jgi:streptogramin lyase
VEEKTMSISIESAFLQVVRGLVGTRSAPRESRRPDRRRARFRLEGLEDRRLLANLAGMTEYPLPTASASPTGIVTGSDGNVWSLENAANKIAMTNVTTHAVDELPIPTASSNPWGIAAGPDGNIWFTERSAGRIGMVNITTHAISEFTIPPNPYSPAPVGITAGADGNLWFTEFTTHKLGMINPTTHAITEYALPNYFGNPPMWITGGSDGNLWFTISAFSWVGKFDLTSHAFTGYTAPGTSAGPAVLEHITDGPDGNIWFSDFNGAVGVVSPATGTITEFPVPTASAAVYGITAGPDGNIWFTEPSVGQIGSINPSSHAVTEYPINQQVVWLTSGTDGNLWFSDRANNAIGVGALATTQWVVTQEPPASLTAGSGFGLTVQAEDSSGTPIAFSGTVTVALGGNVPSGAALGGTLTATATTGLATFSGLTLTKAASGYTLAVSGGGVGWGLSATFAVTPAAATHLAILQQPPSSVGVNKTFGLQAAIEDQYGNIVTSASNSVTVAFGNNPGGATLGGSLTATAVNGIVTFSNLTLNKKGKGYTLQLSSVGLAGVTSNAINV